MSTSQMERLNWSAPRTIWTSAVQLLMTVIAQIPFYFYLREIAILIQEDYEQVVLVVPISTALLLFFLQILMDEYYWNREIIYRNRDITIASAKSFLFVVGLYYFFFFFIMEYWLSSTEFYKESGPKEPVQKMMFDLGISFAIILFMVIFLREIQKRRT